MSSYIGSENETLLFITEFGIWPSSENMHLYYTLKKSFGDPRLLNDVPGHLFMRSEIDETVTFLQVAMDAGWGGYIVGSPFSRMGFISHDEWMAVYGREPLTSVAAQAEELNFEALTS